MTETNLPSNGEAATKPRTSNPKTKDPNAWIPTARVRDHLMELLELGMTRKAIADKAGVSPDRVTIVVDNLHHRVQRKTGEALLGVKWQQTFADDEKHLPWPTRRRVGALNRIGHTTTVVAREGGLSESALQQIMRNQRLFVTSAQAIGVEVAFDKLRDVPGVRPQARLIARRDGWPPPQAYLDGELDDLEENTTARVRARWDKQAVDSPGEQLFDLIEANDYTWAEVAEAIGTNTDAIRRWCSDTALPRSGYVKKMCALFKVDSLPVATASTGPRSRVGKPKLGPADVD